MDVHDTYCYLGIFTDQYKTNNILLDVYWVIGAFVFVFTTLKQFIYRVRYHYTPLMFDRPLGSISKHNTNREA